MSTTSLFAELLIIGGGFSGSVALTTLSLFGYRWLRLADLGEAVVLAAALGTTYLLGIVIDRVADLLFRKWAARIRRPDFGSPDEFRAARALVYSQSSMKEQFEYSRSRLRIVRGSALNAAVGIAAGNLFVWSQLDEFKAVQRQLSVAGTAALLALCAGCVFAWHQLTSTESDNIARESDRLVEA